MIKKIIKYTNFDGVEKTREVYFHLGKADMARVYADSDWLKELQDAAERRDTKVMLEKIEYMVRLSYGIRTEDGEGFKKTREIQDEFIHSAAYEEFIAQLLTEENGFPNFIKSVFPPKLIAEIQEMVKAGRVQDPFAEPTKVSKSASVLSETPVVVDANGTVKDDRPAWMKEHRKPTQVELVEMPKNEMLQAFAQYPELAFEKFHEPKL